MPHLALATTLRFGPTGVMCSFIFRFAIIGLVLHSMALHIPLSPKKRPPPPRKSGQSTEIEQKVIPDAEHRMPFAADHRSVGKLHHNRGDLFLEQPTVFIAEAT